MYSNAGTPDHIIIKLILEGMFIYQKPEHRVHVS